MEKTWKTPWRAPIPRVEDLAAATAKAVALARLTGPIVGIIVNPQAEAAPRDGRSAA